MHPKLQASRKRQAALILAAVVVVCYLLGQLFVLRPMRVSARSKLKDLTMTRGTLNRTGWPLQEDRLKSLLVELSRKREVAASKRAALMNRVGLPFEDRINSRYQSAENFQHQVARLDYQEQFKRLENFLVSNGARISTEVLKLSEDTTGIEDYKLVLQLWTMQTVVGAGLDAGLVLADVPVSDEPLKEGEVRPPRVTDLSALPIVPYLSVPYVEVPYLLRIPIRVRFRGTVKQVIDLLETAYEGDVFFNIDHLEISKPIPSKVGYDDSMIETVIQGSTFYILDSEIGREMMTKPEVRMLPRGA